MSKVLGVVATVASIASIIPGPHQGVARIVATVASVGAAITAKPPPARGSTNQVMIGPNMPTPYTVGRTYCGGNMVQEVGYGGENNPYKTMAFVWSGGGQSEAIEAFQADFTTIGFSGGNATGFYHDFLYLSTSLGTMPQPAALTGPFGAIPGWGATAKLSGKTHGLVTLKFDKKGKRYASGLPQFGVILKGERVYDPRKDSTYPGGSGSHRWDDETTWEWSECPSLHGLAYGRGRYQNGIKVFGVGYPKASIDIASFVAFANVCDANGWKVGGTIYEPGSRKDNLKYILEAGGGEPIFGAKLGVRFNAPKVALDTITADDLAQGGDYVVPGMRSWRGLKNTLFVKVRSEAHRWEYVQLASPVTISAFVTEDGEEKPDEYQFALVQQQNQGAQLGAYKLWNARERGPIVLPCKPRLVGYRKGDALEIDIPELGLEGQLVEIIDKETDLGTGIVTLTMVGETTAKHESALGRTGTAPPTPSLMTSEEIDEVVSANASGAPATAASEAEQLALEVAPGTTVIRTDLGKSYQYNGGTSGTMADWTEIGVVALTAASTAFTPAGNVAAVTVQAAIEELDSEKAKLAGGNTFSGNNRFDDQVSIGGAPVGAYKLTLLGTDLMMRIGSSASTTSNPQINLRHGTVSSILTALPTGMAIGTFTAGTTLDLYIGNTLKGTLSTNGLSITGFLAASTYLKSGSYTVATLPSAATAGAGAKAFVTDASVTTFGTVAAGGGANKVPVTSDGTNWTIG